jgi:hypothetical protein
MSTSLQPPNGILKSGNQTKKIILIIVLPIVFIIMIAIAVVCVRQYKYCRDVDMNKLSSMLQKKSFEVIDPKSGESTSIVYGLPIEYQSNFTSNCELQAQKKLHLLEQIKASKCARNDSEDDRDKQEEFQITDTASDYRDDGTCTIPYLSLQRRSSSSLLLEESLVEFESHEEHVTPNTIDKDEIRMVAIESPTQPAAEEAHLCLNSDPSMHSKSHKKSTVHIQEHGEKIAKQHGINRALFADHSMWDQDLGLISAEDRRNFACWYYGLANPKYETAPGEESWLIALPMDVLWQLAVCLDVPDHPLNYRHLASYFIDDQLVDYLQGEYLNWFGSPTLKLLKTLMAQKPTITIEVLKQRLLHMGRSDCANLLLPYLTEQNRFPVLSKQRGTRETSNESCDEPPIEDRDLRREFLGNASHDRHSSVHTRMNSRVSYQTSGHNSDIV